jgi:hypothetical protein
MENRNDKEREANLPGQTGIENASGNETKAAQFHDNSKEQTTRGTRAKEGLNKEGDDLMQRSDFRYFYSGRKLL